jgi:predicted HAD superfamily phosphohydrolase
MSTLEITGKLHVSVAFNGREYRLPVSECQIILPWGRAENGIVINIRVSAIVPD